MSSDTTLYVILAAALLVVTLVVGAALVSSGRQRPIEDERLTLALPCRLVSGIHVRSPRDAR